MSSGYQDGVDFRQQLHVQLVWDPEGLILNQKMCLSRSLNHYAMDYCQDHPLSLQPVYAQVVKVH